MIRRIFSIAALAAGVLLLASPAWAGSDRPTPYTVTAKGIQLPAGVTFGDGWHVNSKTSQGDKGLHFEAKCVDRTDAECAGERHEIAQYIGKSFLPWSAFGFDKKTLCVTWIQISAFDEHFGEGGQPPIGKGCTKPSTTPTPTPSPSETPTEEPTAEPTDEPSETPTDESTAEPTEEPSETPEPSESPTPTPTPDPSETPTPSASPTPAVSPSETPPSSTPLPTIDATPAATVLAEEAGIDTLPETGSTTGPLVALGVALTATGVVLAWAGRKRGRDEA